VYSWNFNETSTPRANVTGLQQAQQQVHSYSQAGTYIVSITATNAKGRSVSNAVKVTVEGKELVSC
jgi:PKD repeat protein